MASPTVDPTKGIIWLNGEFVPWPEAKVHVMCHSLHYGYGIFEGLRAYDTPKGPAIFRLQDHTRRFFNSAHIMHMTIPFTEQQLNDAQCEIVRVNHFKSAYIRPLCFNGPEGLGLVAKNLKTYVSIAAWDWGTYLGKEALERGVRACISSYTRNHVNSAPTKAKATGNYINSILARREAEAGGYDEAILLDHQGYIAEGSAENLFMVKNGVLYTPELTSVLAGITRDTITTLANDLGIPVTERHISRDELYTADEAFFTGTAVEVTPLREVDCRAIGSGKGRGPITTQLQKLFFDVVSGHSDLHQDWLTLI